MPITYRHPTQVHAALSRKECSTVFGYKCRILDVITGNFPGDLENMLCSYCDTIGTETQHTYYAGMPTLYGSNKGDRSHKAG